MPTSRSLASRETSPTYLPVQPYGQDVAGVAVVTDLRAFLEVIDVHLPRLRAADHHDQAAGEQALHDVDIRDLVWEGKWPEVTQTAASPATSRGPPGLAVGVPSLSPHSRFSSPLRDALSASQGSSSKAQSDTQRKCE